MRVGAVMAMTAPIVRAASGKGARFAPEQRWLTDEKSGRRLRQVTSHPSIHHHPFFIVPAWDRAGEKLVFVSHRTGAPQIFFEERASGELVQVTDRSDLAEWSGGPAPGGRGGGGAAGAGAGRGGRRDF